MNKALIVLAGVALVMGGCKSTPPASVATKKPDCVFPDIPSEEAPGWVCDLPVEGVAVSAVGTHEKTGAGVAFQKDQALADGRVKLAQQMRVRVTNMIKRYAETTGAASTETVDMVNTSVSKLITDETLSGSRPYRSTTNAKGTIYVLVGLDESATRQSAEQALKTSMKNERALWQQFKAKQAQEELAAELAKQAAGQ